MHGAHICIVGHSSHLMKFKDCSLPIPLSSVRFTSWKYLKWMEEILSALRLHLLISTVAMLPWLYIYHVIAVKLQWLGLVPKSVAPWCGNVWLNECEAGHHTQQNLRKMNEGRQNTYGLTWLLKYWRSTTNRVETTIMVVHMVPRAHHSVACESAGSTWTIHSDEYHSQLLSTRES